MEMWSTVFMLASPAATLGIYIASQIYLSGRYKGSQNVRLNHIEKEEEETSQELHDLKNKLKMENGRPVYVTRSECSEERAKDREQWEKVYQEMRSMRSDITYIKSAVLGEYNS